MMNRVNTLSSPRLYHISESSNIAHLEPRVAKTGDNAVVWAIHENLLHNYLLPRDCPRVTFYAKADSTSRDIELFLGGSKAVVAVEDAWSERIESAVLYCYQLPADTFECIDVGAGYYVSTKAVTPVGLREIRKPMQEIRDRGVEVRFMPELQELARSVVASSLQFSLIRMRNAAGA